MKNLMSVGRTRTYVTAVAFAAMALVVGLWYAGPSTSGDQVEAAVFFSLAAFFSHALAYRLPRGGFGDITFIPLLAGVAIVPSVAMSIGTAAALLVAEYFRKREPIRIIFNAAQLTTAVCFAVLVYEAAGGVPVSRPELGTAVPFIAAFATFVVSNAILFAGVVAMSSQERFSAVLLRVVGGTSFVYDLVGIPIVLGFAYAYVLIGWVWSGALLLPLFGVRQMYKVNRELQTVNEELLHVMVAAIEARDPYTSGHSQRVAAYSRVVARAAGLGPWATERVFTAAILHDVGKIHEEFAPILRKPGRLTDDEFAVMKSHSAKGAALVSKVSQFEDLIPAVRGHHEAWNGSGYPDGLRGEAIPLWARVIAFADTMDAMTTDRPYREALTTDMVRREITSQAGRQFDPQIASALASDAVWPQMAAEIRKNRHTHVTPTTEMPIPRHSAAYETPYAGISLVSESTGSKR